MTRLYLMLAFLIVVSMANAQEFCGVIRYKYTYYKGKSKKDVTAKVKEIKTEDFFICGNKFKTYFDGKLKDVLITDSLTYFLVRADSIVGYVKADSAYGERLSDYGKIIDGITYKDKVYKSIEVNSKNQLITYYFNDDVKINPESFSGVELYHWNKYFTATSGSLRLVSISKRGRLTIVSEAIEVKRMNLQDFDFLFPAGFKFEQWDNFKVYN